MPTSLIERTRFLCTMENPDDEKQNSHPSQDGDLPDGLVLVSSGDEAPEDEDHEEGEIQDEDEEEHQQQQRRQLPPELEDISSEEESNIRERMAALEARNKKVGMMKKKIASRSLYGYLNEEDVMNGKENYCYYYQTQHQQPSYRSQKVYKASVPINREDNRHGGTVKHKRTSASGTKRHAEKPAKEKPPKRSSHRHRKRRKYASSRSPSPADRRAPVSSDSEPEPSAVDREYLKLALGIGNSRSGRSQSGRNPLKKKLFLQASEKRKSGNAAEGNGKRKVTDAVVLLDSSSSEQEIELDEEEEEEEDGEEEDEEELKLRLLALSSKPIVREAGFSDFISELQIPSPPPPPSIQLVDQQVEEQSAEELRMIALKTAILKKHATRRKRQELDGEQPYSPSDDIVLSPVRELPPTFDQGVYSDGRESVEEMLNRGDGEDDDDVQIVEPQYEQIDLIDSDDNGHDMEISPVGSPHTGTDRTEQDMEEDSQQPIDMELASSDSCTSGRPSPVGEFQGEIVEQTNSCDSPLFHRRGDLVPESPPVTPDSMEEAEAEALRHLLLTKMRQKQSKKLEVVVPPVEQKVAETVDEGPVPLEGDSMETGSSEVPALELEHEEQEEEEEEEVVPSINNHHLSRPNLITLVGEKRLRKRKRSSLSSTKELAESTPASTTSPIQPELPPELPKATAVAATVQKLVNNPNKLININRTAAAPSPTAMLAAAATRTESPKELTTVDTFVSRPVTKLVIQLGNSDSDSDVDFGSATPEQQETGAPNAGKPTEATVMPTARFEEQLDKFLKSVRSKSTATGGADGTVEQAERGEATSGKSLHSTRLQNKHAAKRQPASSSTMATPTAVKHLSKSAQLEYMKLVARMAQLERDKIARQQNFATSKNASSSTGNAPRDNSVPNAVDGQPASSGKSVAEQRMEPKAGRSPGRRKQSFSSGTGTVRETETSAAPQQPPPALDSFERKLQQLRTSLPKLAEASRNRLLLNAEKQYEKHSDTFLSDLEQHNATIIEAQQVRRELYHLENRIDLLREKLSLLEKVHDRHRHRTRDTFTNLHTTRKKILSGRKRSGELERICIEIGRAVKGETYQLPVFTNGVDVQAQMRILIAEMQQLKSIRKPSLEEFKEEMIANHRRRLTNEAPDDSSEPSDERLPEEEPKKLTVAEETVEKNASEISEQKEESGKEESAIASEECPKEMECVKDAECNEAPEVQSVDTSKDAEECVSPVDSGSKQTEGAIEAISLDDKTSPTEQKDLQYDVEMREEKTIASSDCLSHEKEDSNQEKEDSNQEKEDSNQEKVDSNQEKVDSIQEKEDSNQEKVDSNQEKVDSNQEKDPLVDVKEEVVQDEVFRMEKYTSPLMSLKQGAQNIHTGGILCPYELDGQCVDRDCKYEHLNERLA